MCSYEGSQLLCLWKPRALYQATSNTSEQSCGHFFPKCRQQTALEKERDGSTSSNVSVPRAHCATGTSSESLPRRHASGWLPISPEGGLLCWMGAASRGQGSQSWTPPDVKSNHPQSACHGPVQQGSGCVGGHSPTEIVFDRIFPCSCVCGEIQHCKNSV